MVKPGRKRTVDCLAASTFLVLPWGVFTAASSLLTFSWHYTMPNVTRALCAVLLVLVLFVGYSALLSYSAYVGSTRDSGGAHKPARLVFLFAMCLVAWIAGVAVGHQSYASYMGTYFDITDMNVYPMVDPSTSHGQQLMDAGRLLFSPGSRLDLGKPMGFRNGDMYCVAPVTISSGGEKMPYYDFWAVGVNCCSGNNEDFDFRCGDYKNPHARAGVRITNDAQRPYFRLAVQQAEAAYKISAQHPIFIHWLQDPVAEITHYEAEGVKYFLLGVFGFLVFELFAVAAAAVWFSKMDS